jgi:hypothetical protein
MRLRSVSPHRNEAGLATASFCVVTKPPPSVAIQDGGF